MNVLLFDLPENEENTVQWLEQILCSPQAGQLIGEVAAFRSVVDDGLADDSGSHSPEADLDQLLGEQKTEVIQNGLRSLDQLTLRRLLQSPNALSDLLIEIELAESPYWRFLEPLTTIPVGSGSEITCDAEPKASSIAAAGQTNVQPTPGHRHWLAILASLAAATLFAVTFWSSTGKSEWAWQRPGVFTVTLEGPTYLQHLASAAHEWFQQTPAGADALRAQIVNFRRGCDHLLAAPHSQLAAADRQWLLQRCDLWAGKLDDQLERLERGENWERIRQEADETIEKLIHALETRARELA